MLTVRDLVGRASCYRSIIKIALTVILIELGAWQSVSAVSSWAKEVNPPWPPIAGQADNMCVSFSR